MSERQLCALSAEEEEEDEVTEVHTSTARPKRKYTQGPGALQTNTQTEALTQSLNAILEEQKKQVSNATNLDPNIILEAMKRQEESHKAVLQLIEHQTLKKAEEEFSREEAIKFAFEGGEDDAEFIIAHEVRSGLRPFRGDWAERWKSLGRYAKPRKESIGLPQVGTLSLSPVVIRTMHDRGRDLKLSMFIHLNQDVSVRSGRVSNVAKGDRDHVIFEHYDWKEAETVQSVAEAALSYLIALSRIWPEDWSGMVLLKTLIRYKYLANANVPTKTQLFVLTSFTNSFFGLCATAGRDLKPPPVWREAEALMHEVLDKNHIDHTQCRTGRDPYVAQQNNNRPHHQPHVHQFNNQPKKKQKGHNGGNSTNQGDLANMPLGKLTLAQKQAIICRDFNKGICAKPDCRYRHRCNVVTAGDRVCYSTDHAGKDHV